MYRGDNSAFAGAEYIRIELENNANVTISKAEFRSGKVLKTFENPLFPLIVNFDEEESMLLDNNAIGYLAVYDELGRKRTVKGYISFKTKGKVV